MFIETIYPTSKRKRSKSNLYLFCDAVMKSLKHLVSKTGDAA